MSATAEGEGEASTSTTASLAFVPRRLGAGGTRGRGRGRRPGLSSSSSSSTSARPRPPPQLLPHDVDFPQDTLLHATVSLDLGGRADASEEQRNRLVDRLVRRKLERLAPRSVDYVAVRRVKGGDGGGGGGEGQVVVECIIRAPSSLKARQLVDKYNANTSKATSPPADPQRRRRPTSTGVVSLRILTMPEQAAVWRDEMPKGVKTRARRRATRRAGRAEDDGAKSKLPDS